MKKYFIHVLLCLMMAFGGISVMGQPTITGYNPAIGAAIPVDQPLKLTFNEAISIDNNGYVAIMTTDFDDYIDNIGSSFRPISLSLSPDDNNHTLVITVSGGNLLPNKEYTVMISEGVISSASGVFPEWSMYVNPENYWHFTTEEAQLLIQSMNPTHGASNASIKDNLIITFNENISLGNGTIDIWKDGENSFSQRYLIIDGENENLDLNGAQLSIPHLDFEYDTDYYVLISNGAIISDGASFGGITKDGEVQWHFKTEKLKYELSPHLGAENVQLNAELLITFDASTVTREVGKMVYIYEIGNPTPRAVPSITIQIVNGNQARIPHSNFLKVGKEYYIVINNETFKLDSEFFSGIAAGEWQFKTINPTPFDEPIFDPETGSTIAVDQPLKITFNQPIQLGAGRIIVQDINGIEFPVDVTANNAAGILSLENDNKTLVITHSDFKYETQYYVRISGTAITSTEGALFGGFQTSSRWNFFTEGIPSPKVKTYNPEQGIFDAPIDEDLVLTFDQDIILGESGYIEIWRDGSASYIQRFVIMDGENENLILDGAQLSILHLDFVSGSTYSVKISEGAIISATTGLPFRGLGLGEDTEDWIFTTISEPFEWGGGGDPFDWHDPENWDELGFPNNENAIVIIPAGLNNYPVISIGDDIVVANLTIAAGALLSQTGGKLTVKGLLKLESSSDVNASFIKTGGEIEINRTEVDQVMNFGMYETYLTSSSVFGATTSNLIESPYQIQVRYPDAAGNLQNYSGALQTGHGYSIRSTSPLLTFKGTIYDNPIRPVAVDVEPGYLWKQVGNPYPASIKWTAMVNDNLEESFWIWIHGTSANSGSYGVYNGASGVETNNIGSLIPSNHGFLVKALNANGGIVNFSKTSLVPNESTYLRAPKATPPHIKLAGVKDSNKDEIAVAFISEATDGVDRFDSEKYFSDNANLMELYTYSANMKSAINSLPYTENMEIPLCFSVKQTGNFSIELTADNTENGTVLLIDKEMGNATINLTEAGSYSFDVAATGRNESRFVLKFSGKVVDIETTQTTPINVFAGEKTIFVEVPVSNENRIDYKLIDVSGRLINDGYLVTGAHNTIDVATAGVYMLVINNQEFFGNYKVVVK